jgi:hypothetical protein
MRVITAICVGIFLLLAVAFAALKIYQNQFPQHTTIEHWRNTADQELWNGYMSGNSIVLWINRAVFHNQDKYAWYPPRILPVYYTDGTIHGYQLYGMVTSWDPENKLLTLNSYIGKTLFVRFDPKPGGSVAYMPKFDAFGQMQFGDLPVIRSTDIPDWNTVFCRYDILSIEAKTADAFNRASEKSPLVPAVITLYNRLCKQ